VAQLRAFVQRQAAVVQGAQKPTQILGALAARELLLVIGARAGLAELEDGRLLADVRALLAHSPHALVAAQARGLVEQLVAVQG
jgi:hypothetical protein